MGASSLLLAFRGLAVGALALGARGLQLVLGDEAVAVLVELVEVFLQPLRGFFLADLAVAVFVHLLHDVAALGALFLGLGLGGRLARFVEFLEVQLAVFVLVAAFQQAGEVRAQLFLVQLAAVVAVEDAELLLHGLGLALLDAGHHGILVGQHFLHGQETVFVLVEFLEQLFVTQLIAVDLAVFVRVQGAHHAAELLQGGAVHALAFGPCGLGLFLGFFLRFLFGSFGGLLLILREKWCAECQRSKECCQYHGAFHDCSLCPGGQRGNVCMEHA
ncbi:MAG: hypothetical protein M5U25_17270 [Planctomycetota bacterium]|nr:hypothetical protein [Planctomycetota bacterium]